MGLGTQRKVVFDLFRRIIRQKDNFSAEKSLAKHAYILPRTPKAREAMDDGRQQSSYFWPSHSQHFMRDYGKSERMKVASFIRLYSLRQKESQKVGLPKNA